MSGKSRRASTSITLSGTRLDGYSGPIDMVRYSRRRWWHRLRLGGRKARTTRLYVNVKSDMARAWRRGE